MSQRGRKERRKEEIKKERKGIFPNKNKMKIVLNRNIDKET